MFSATVCWTATALVARPLPYLAAQASVSSAFGLRVRLCLGCMLPRQKSPYVILVINMVQFGIVETTRKITVEVPPQLLERAQRASGAGITQTVRTGLQLVAASQAYDRLRGLRGKVRFTRTLAELKADR